MEASTDANPTRSHKKHKDKAISFYEDNCDSLLFRALWTLRGCELFEGTGWSLSLLLVGGVPLSLLDFREIRITCGGLSCFCHKE